MPRKKTNTDKPQPEIVQWPKITQGNHSTFIEHQNGKVEYNVDWDKLAEEINIALTNYKNSSNISKPKQTKRKNAA